MKIPGFRSGIWWKKVIATIYYAWIASLIETYIIAFFSHGPTDNMLLPIVFFILFGITTVLFIDRYNLKYKKPPTR